MSNYENISVEEIKGYRRDYSEDKLWSKIKSYYKIVGVNFIYKVLVLYYLTKSKITPVGVKAIIYGALGYFIFPIDLIPDMIPIVGFKDDLVALITVLSSVIEYITPEIKDQSFDKLDDFFDLDDIPEESLSLEK